MAIERTFSIIKPDGVEKGVIGRVIARFEAVGLKPVAMKLKRLSQAEAEGFYAVHRARPFFADLVKSMTCGPVVLMVLEGEGAIARNREVMGATDPKKAAAGTLRADFATDIEKNTVHGSDAPETAKVEISYFFPEIEVHAYDWKDKR
jgi:nucleoside-diphosphate kinase